MVVTGSSASPRYAARPCITQMMADGNTCCHVICMCNLTMQISNSKCMCKVAMRIVTMSMRMCYT